MVVDLFSKYNSHFVALKHPFTALSVAKMFMQHIYRLHGLPTALVSDRDRIFTSQLWRELFHLAIIRNPMDKQSVSTGAWRLSYAVLQITLQANGWIGFI